MTDFYQLSAAIQKLSTGQIKKTKVLSQDLFYVQTTDMQFLTFEEKDGRFNCIHRGNSCPLCVTRDSFIFQSQDGIVVSNRQGETLSRKVLPFTPKYFVPIKMPPGEALKYDLLLSTNKSNCLLITQEGDQPRREVAPSGSLARILQSYTKILKCTQVAANLIILTVFYEPSNVTHLLLIEINTSDSIKFVQRDVYKMKPGKVLNSLEAQEISSETGIQQFLVTICHSGSKMFEVTMSMTDGTRQTRLSRKLFHDFSFQFKIKQVIPISSQGQYLVRDQTNQLYIFSPRANKKAPKKTVNLFTPEDYVHGVVDLDGGIYVIQEHDNEIVVKSLEQMNGESLLRKMITEGNLRDAVNFVRSTGQGVSQLLAYQLERTNYSDPQALRKYLEECALSFDQIIDILFNKKVLNSEALTLLVDSAIQKCEESQAAHKLQNAKRRLSVYRELVGPDAHGAQNFCFEASFLESMNELLYSEIFTTDSQHIIKVIFEELTIEAIQNYKQLLEIIPIELVSPSSMLPYLPPGKSTKLSEFWTTVKSMLEPEVFQKIFEEDSLQIFDTISFECVYELNQPGKAVLYLTEAICERQIHTMQHQVDKPKGINLPWIALEATERSLLDTKKREIPEGRQERCLILMNDPKSIAEYFSQLKWIFVIDQTLYQRYLKEVSWLVQNGKVVLDELLSAQGNPTLVALQDVDLVQMALDCIYLDVKLCQSEHILIIMKCLQTLSKSQNQQLFFEKYLDGHVEIAKVSNSLQLPKDMTFRELLQLQIDSKNAENIKRVEQLCKDSINSNLQVSSIESLKGMTKSMLATGSSVFDTGRQFIKRNLARRGLPPAQDDVLEVPTIKPEKWILIFNQLTLLIERLGYETNLDLLVIEQAISSKQIQALDQLLRWGNLDISTVQMAILNHVKNFFSRHQTVESDIEDQFFMFYPFALNILELLSQTIESSDSISLGHERRLLEATAALFERQLLVGTMPLAQIRADYFSLKLIERILQVHGFSRYPDHLEIMMSLQVILGQPRSEVVINVLNHLDKIKYLDNIKEQCPYMIELCTNYVVKNAQLEFSEQLAKMLVKILKQENSPILLSYLMDRVDKQSEEFSTICELQYLHQAEAPPSHLDQLSKALSWDIPSKLKYYLRKDDIRELSFQDQCRQMSFTSKKSLQRFCKINEQHECLQRVKLAQHLRPEFSINDLIRVAITNPEQMESIQQEEKAVVESPSRRRLSPLEQLKAAKSEQELYEALLLDFSHSDDRVNDKFQIDIALLKEAFVGEKWLGKMLSEYLLEKHCYVFSLIQNDQQKGLVKSLLSCGIQLNLLELIEQDVPNDRFGTLIPGSYLCRLNSFLYKLAYLIKNAHLTEVNLYTISLCFEQSGLADSRLPTILLYANCLEYSLKSGNISEPLLQFVDYETIISLLYTEDKYQNDYTKSVIKQINEKFMSLSSCRDSHYLLSIDF